MNQPSESWNAKGYRISLLYVAKHFINFLYLELALAMAIVVFRWTSYDPLDFQTTIQIVFLIPFGLYAACIVMLAPWRLSFKIYISDQGISVKKILRRTEFIAWNSMHKIELKCIDSLPYILLEPADIFEPSLLLPLFLEQMSSVAMDVKQFAGSNHELVRCLARYEKLIR